MTTLFTGEYEYKVDEKGRVPIPPKWRREFGGSLYLTSGADKCVTSYTVEEFDRARNEVGDNSLQSVLARKLLRAIVGASQLVELDGQGRVVISSSLRAHASIGDSAVVVGLGNHFEIWNPELWRDEKTADVAEMSQNIEKLKAERRQ
jgi:MraZ protein